MEAFIERQHDEHMRGYHFHLYMRDAAKRVVPAMQGNLTSQQRADIELAHWQLLKVRA